MSWESGAGVYLGRVTGHSRIAHRSCSQSPCNAENGCSHAESSSRQRSGPSDGPWPGRRSAPGEQKDRLGSPRAVVPGVPPGWGDEAPGVPRRGCLAELLLPEASCPAFQPSVLKWVDASLFLLKKEDFFTQNELWLLLPC